MLRELGELLGHVDGPVGVGVDVEEVARWERPVESLFTAGEHAYCRGFARPAESYAGRWCAKEAVFKAVAPYLTLTVRDIEIYAGPDGAPQVRLAGPAAGWDGRIVVSIAHTATVAVAIAVARPGGRAASDKALWTHHSYKPE